MNKYTIEKLTPESSKITTILVLGATGGVGQILVAKLIAQNYQIIAIVRNMEKAQKLFGDSPNIRIFSGDIRQQKSLIKATSGNYKKIIVGQGDKLLGETSRIIVAEACV
mgnify:FL=1